MQVFLALLLGLLVFSVSVHADNTAVAETATHREHSLPDKPAITFDAQAIKGDVSPLIFGANHRWVSNATGSADPQSGITYEPLVAQIRDVGVTMIRYPAGLLGNLFQWERAIGPQAQRGQQISGLVIAPVPFDSKFGVDEYGDLLDRSGAAGNLLINFATANAADAANFVAYMTAPQGSPKINGVDWAARRAVNGHPAPHNVVYVEIGNEYEPAIQKMIDQNYWILGEPVQINASCAIDKISCLYAFGGATRFEKQPVVQLTDWRPATSISAGVTHQVFHARYAPVIANSVRVFVDNAEWTRTTHFNDASKSFTINARTGSITFGDGKRGAIPPKGAKITVSYTSGPHEGFVDFYRAIKAANPSVRVCTSIHDESFLRIMADKHPYDCIQQHPYVIGNPKIHTLSGGLNDFFVHMAARTLKLGDQVAHTQALVRKHAGANAGNVTLLLTEYGQLGTFPDFAPHFARSQGQAVLHALCIRDWVLKQVGGAARTVLTDYTFKPIPSELAAVQSSDVAAAEAAMKNPVASTAGDFAMFGGPGPDTVVTPVGWAMKLLRENTGDKVIASSVQNSPKVTSSKQDSLDALYSYATRDTQGNIYLVVINIDPTQDHTVTIAPDNNAHSLHATISTIASSDINDENNPQQPSHVTIATKQVELGSTNFKHIFARHSVTAIKLSL